MSGDPADTKQERRRLIREVWPDKRLYACVMLFVAGLAGVLYTLLLWYFPFTYAGKMPSVFVDAWPSATFVACLGVVAGASVSLWSRSNLWAYIGAFLGLASFGFLGIVPLLSLIALGFLIASSREGEDTDPRTRALHPSMWPDKSLAASLVLFVGGIVALAWAGALVGRVFNVLDTLPQEILGGAAAIAGILALWAAWLAYHQHGRALCLAAVACLLLTGGFYVIGPLLALASLVLVQMAQGEREFDDASPAA